LGFSGLFIQQEFEALKHFVNGMLTPRFAAIMTGFTSLPALAAGSSAAHANFPIPLTDYAATQGGIFDQLASRVAIEPFNLAALIVFALAVMHTFAAGRIMALSHKVEHHHAEKLKQQGKGDSDEVSFLAKLLHYLGEIEAIFGIWALVLIGVISAFKGWSTAVHYISGTVNYTEPMFVVVIMTIAATRPILNFSESIIQKFARLGGENVASWWLALLTLGPILGSFITEPAAMTICALLLSKQVFRHEPKIGFRYATLGLLFVNVSVGGTLTNFAAPPVLMVAAPWGWSTGFMLANFGWKAIIGIVISNIAYFAVYRGELKRLQQYKTEHQPTSNIQVDGADASVPFWIVAVHIAFMGWTVLNAHYPAMFIGGFLFFLGFQSMTPQHQNKLELRTAMLVGFFLAGLVIHGGLQGWWISPVLSSLTEVPLMVMATVLTAFNDNALITYLSTLVQGFSPALKYAVVAGAVTGGGLTVIANAPNPAGQAILGKFFPNKAVNPLGLFAGAIIPTIVMGLCFMLL
jgi:hypothetical protein